MSDSSIAKGRVPAAPSKGHRSPVKGGGKKFFMGIGMKSTPKNRLFVERISLGVWVAHALKKNNDSESAYFREFQDKITNPDDDTYRAQYNVHLVACRRNPDSYSRVLYV